MVDFISALGPVGNVFKFIAKLFKIPKELSEAEWKLKNAELSSELADVKKALLDANARSKAKDEEIARLAKSFTVFKKTIEVDGYRYGKPTGHPYCPVCVQKGVMIHLTPTWEAGRPKQCPNCKAKYQATSYHRPRLP